ncbi:MAG: glutathione reductase (NADPH) [Planctomycetota bacterium]|jgi:glutathione reductase (NADPH)
MPKFDYDLFVIGAGSGGVRASRMAAQTGAKVAVAEERYLGGTCVNVGCVPKKLLVYASHYAEAFKEAEGFGWQVGERSFSWKNLIAKKDAEIARLNGIYRTLLDNAGVELVEGRGHLVDAHTVQVGDQTYSAKHILVAVGGWPDIPTFPGCEHAINSNAVFHLEEQPKRVLIVGGGYIAVEFAGIFNGMGSQVTQLYRGELFLRGFDADVRTHLRDEMIKKGVDLRFNMNVEKIEKTDNGLACLLTDGSTHTADVVFYATGRSALTQNLGLKEAGVDTNERGVVIVDEYSKTSADSVYAIGDVTDRINLTPVALHEGMALVETLFKNNPTKPKYDNVASAVFSQPACGSVGLAEHEAREKGFDVEVYRSAFKPMKHSLSGLEERTMMKIIVCKKTDKVLGIHMVGPDAGEIIQGFAVAMKVGVTKAQLDATIGIHPTSAEELVTMRTPVQG